MIASVRAHWPHYLIEAWGLGTFMFVAAGVSIGLARLPGPAAAFLASHAMLGRAAFGVAMGATAMAIVYSPWGSRSGAHLNPALTLAYAWLRKIAPWDAAFYIAAQFAGGAAGFALAAALAGPALGRPPARYLVTIPGPFGAGIAFAAEMAMTFVLMTVVLRVSNAPPPRAHFTGVAAGLLVATYITFEAPLSGMSLNPARTLASSLQAHDATALWLYFTAPPLGMLTAAALFLRQRGRAAVRCARLNHRGPWPCIFRCDYAREHRGSTALPRDAR